MFFPFSYFHRLLLVRVSTLLYLTVIFVLIAYCIYNNKQNYNIPSILNFNEPLTTKFSNKKLIENLKHHQLEQKKSLVHLSDIKKIKEQNSDLLPMTSAFGTDFSNPEWTKTICIEDEEDCVGKFKDLETLLRSAPSYKTLTCIIEKNMSTLLQALMCFLFDEKKFKESNRVFTLEGYDIRLCLNKNEYNSITKAKEVLHLADSGNNDWLYLVAVRDPVERFISAYVDKCVRQPRKDGCNGCKANITCFIITEYERIMENSFSNSISKTFEDVHFFPQLWHCNFSTEIQNYKLLHYSSDPQNTGKFLDDLLNLLLIQKVPKESLEFIKDQLTSGRTVHSTVTSEARVFYEERLKSSPFLLEYVIRMYYWDYRLFGFELPKF